MAVPKRKTSPSRRGMRRSADALKKPSYVEDKDWASCAAPTTSTSRPACTRAARCSSPAARRNTAAGLIARALSLGARQGACRCT